MRTRATIHDRDNPTHDGETVDREELYVTSDGSLAVLEVGKGAFAVYHRHGVPGRPGAVQVPHTVTGADRAKHPAAVGQEIPRSASIVCFRTKTGARKYMQAVEAAGILPSDRQATRAEIQALADWIRKEVSA